MAVTSGMFLFEVVVEKVNSLVESRFLVIRSEFADIFSLELKDPKQMHIVMPDPLPPPPEPVGKKGKKKKKPKPKKGKKKGKKGAIELPPPEPAIQSGQSVLFSSSAEVLSQNMDKCPLEVSLWSKEDELVYIGSVSIPWDPIFQLYLKKICACQEPPPVTLKEDYNIFQERTAKMMAKIGLQVKLRFLASQVTTAFRTLSEDPNVRKCLYTGINSKTTSYICTLKTTDTVFEENSNKIGNKFTVDKHTLKPKKIAYADFRNAPGANLTFFKDGDYCCMDQADKPPDSIYKAAETCPDIDFIVDYVRKIIVSCNDNMRMLTPRPTIRPRIKATDIDRLCYCKETGWPPGQFAERFKREAQSGPCPICIDTGKKPRGVRGATFDIANIRGPCGRPDCRIARDMRAYIENLVDEDNVEFNINDLIGPCGSKECTLATKIQQFLRHEGAFNKVETKEGLSTQCACIERMQKELTKRDSCASVCSKDCEETGSDASHCGGLACPYENSDKNRVYHVYYFTVEHDFDKPDRKEKPSGSSSPEKSAASATPGKSTGSPKSEKSAGSPKSEKSTVSPKSGKSAASKPSTPSESRGSAPSDLSEDESDTRFRYCPASCPIVKIADMVPCSKDMCNVGVEKQYDTKCGVPSCKHEFDYPPSPADSNIVVNFDEIHNPCCIKSCDISERVKEFIEDGTLRREKRKKCKELEVDDPCYCDCVCTFKFSNKTTYCMICGGYECLGDDTRDLPAYARPHPCPVYHKLYDKKYIKTKSPWPDEEKDEQKKDTTSSKTSKVGLKATEKTTTTVKVTKAGPPEKEVKTKESAPEKPKKTKENKKKVAKTAANVSAEPAQAPVDKKPNGKNKYAYPPVPKTMGWNWTAEDIPGMKPRPKWKPGAAHKVLVRRYRALREGTDTIAKKKRAMMQRKKKIEMKPTLVVRKQDGEFTVQMEVFKQYSKERLLHQYPYDEKPPLIYTIGKTAAEKNKIQRQRDRKARRESRRKSRLLQSTFRDKCQEICLKAYNQAIGVLPLPNPNFPDCPCVTNADPGLSPIIDSCSCSDVGTISSSDTDHDEWVIEFTPPMARWDAKAKHLPVMTDNESQYNYMDYKVKLYDRSGNPVPRFFKSHEGKTECSDLGGFWGPGKVWLEINKDGYIGPDERWVPMNFVGPDGMFYSAEEGSFTDNTGQVLKLGIDGYIDKDLKWVWYPKKKPSKSAKSTATASTVDPKKGTKPPAEPLNKAKDVGTTDSKKGAKPPAEPINKGKDAKSKPTGSLTGSPGQPAGGKGAGDKNAGQKGGKGKNIEKKFALVVPPTTGAKKNITETAKNPVVMNVSIHHDRGAIPRVHKDRMPGMDHKKLARYRQIMEDLHIYDDLCELKPPTKTNRASNTPRRKCSRYTVQGLFKNTPSMTNVISYGHAMNKISPTNSMYGPWYK